jgi:hypothetical protein
MTRTKTALLLVDGRLPLFLNLSTNNFEALNDYKLAVHEHSLVSPPPGIVCHVIT